MNLAGVRRPGRTHPGIAVVSPTAWSPAVEALMRATRERHAGILGDRERLVTTSFGLALVPALVAIALVVPDPRQLHVVLTLALLAGFVFAARVEFQIGRGYAVPTQLVVVPMLFLLPAAAVAAVIGVGYVIARAPALASQPRLVERAVTNFGDAWYAVAPALVIVLAGAETPSWPHWPVYLAAMAAQLLLDTAVSCSCCALAYGTRMIELMREIRWAHRVDLLLAPLGLVAAIASRDAQYAWIVVVPIVALLAGFARERATFVENQLELARAYRGTALLLGDVVEDDDEYTGRHSRSVGQLALEVAEDLGVDDQTRRDIEFGALLHDVGKVRMPKEIINKRGKLTDEEWAIMRTHTIEGERMLQRVGGVLDGVGRIVRASHERWDGAGYPDGLAGETIPLAARVITCCDAFSAMTTDRPYRAARPFSEAICELEACAGSHFDPTVVAAVIRALARYPRDTQIESSCDDDALTRFGAQLDNHGADLDNRGGRRVEHVPASL